MRNPPLYHPLPTPGEMTRWDHASESLYGIPALLLMENAAHAAVEVLREYVDLTRKRSILIFAGKGNNGGDGIAVGRLLHDEGHRVCVLLTAPPEALPSPAKEHAAMAMTLGLSFCFPDQTGELPLINEATAFPEGFAGFGRPEAFPDAVIDALTGTGIQGELRARERALVRRLNSFRGKAFILALDIPSGLSGLTGKAMPEAVLADATVCFEAGKPGLYMPGASAYTGRLHVRRVGMPLELRRRFPASWRLIRPDKGAWAAPSPFSHKGTAGKVLIIGGSAGMAGAPVLSAMGSLRAGAGLVHVAMPGALEASARSILPEALITPVGQGAQWQAHDAETLCRLVQELCPGCVVIGPGMGREPAVAAILAALLQEPGRPPALLDADALYFFHLQGGLDQQTSPAENRDASGTLIDLLKPGDILTPHPGEMARLLPSAFFQENGLTAQANAHQRIQVVQENRAEALGCCLNTCGAVFVLKGPGTLVGRSGSPVALSPFSVAALGVGGSGDVLAGLCGALVASGFESLDAACLAVYLHGRAGELLSENAARGHLSSEIADALPRAWEELGRGEHAVF